VNLSGSNLGSNSSSFGFVEYFDVVAYLGSYFVSYLSSYLDSYLDSYLFSNLDSYLDFLDSLDSYFGVSYLDFCVFSRLDLGFSCFDPYFWSNWWMYFLSNDSSNF